MHRAGKSIELIERSEKAGHRRTTYLATAVSSIGYDTNHLEWSVRLVTRAEASPERILARPQARRQRLVYHGDLRRCIGVDGGESTPS